MNKFIEQHSQTAESVESILEFWFGTTKLLVDDDCDALKIAAAKSALWWQKNPETDREITERFGGLVQDIAAATRGELAKWDASPLGWLALIICTDQFPRNIYRDTPRAFATDAIADRYAGDIFLNNWHEKLAFIARVFAYLPFEHSEDPLTQERSVWLYATLANEVAEMESQPLPAPPLSHVRRERAPPITAGATEIPATATELFTNYFNYARRHRDIVLHFRRFPHRNAILGRKSYPEEIEFLKQPNSSF